MRCIVDVSVPARRAPGSPGAESRTPAPFVRSTLRVGQILDVLSDVVRENPGWFRWPARDVTPEDVERLEKLEGLGRERDEAVKVRDRRECGGRRLTGQRLTGAHSLKWLPPIGATRYDFLFRGSRCP